MMDYRVNKGNKYVMLICNIKKQHHDISLSIVVRVKKQKQT